ncbi:MULTISPECIES: hypothetical protein [unclassified Bradyrhizobium]|uniref:hypothetical protein n=1 Tax=unclassified Bradyrhizobium TaxID=2631580 RepID=UPI002306A000|nr:MULTISPECIES: hypothetical protein [unclassified Bradyrhizobium]
MKDVTRLRIKFEAGTGDRCIERELLPPNNSSSPRGVLDTPTNPSRVSGSQASPERLQFPK